MSNRTLPQFMALAFLFAAGHPAEAQSSQAAQGVQKPGTRVPAQFESAPPVLTSDQVRALEEQMNEGNFPSPPLRVEAGAVVARPSVPGTAAAPPPQFSFAARPQSVAPAAANTFTFSLPRGVKVLTKIPGV